MPKQIDPIGTSELKPWDTLAPREILELRIGVAFGMVSDLGV